MTDDLDYRLRNAESSLHTLGRRIDDLESEHEGLESKLGFTEDLDYDLRRIRDSVSECEERAEQLEEKAGSLEDELTGRADDVERSVARLTQHVRLLEGQVIAASGVPTADLMSFSTDHRELAAAMLRGWKAAAALLSPHEADTHRRRIQQFHTTRSEHRAAREAVVNLVAVLAGQRWQSKEHTDAARQLPAAISHEAVLRKRATGQADAAHESTEALAADARTRATNRPDIDAGARAEQRLTLALRTRISSIVSDRLLLPVWFVTVFGAAPPARRTEAWLECATDVLLYRLAHDIDDQVLALGAAPDSEDIRRCTWYKELCNNLRSW